MKITIDIADNLLEQARRKAALEKRTLKEVVEEALRSEFSARRPTEPFRLRRHTFKGKGLQPGIVEGEWERIRELIYRT